MNYYYQPHNNNAITLTLFHNACEHVFTMQPQQPLSAFAALISRKLKLNIAEYHLIYNNQPVSIADTALTQLIGDNQAPLFMLRNKHYTQHINNTNSSNYDIYVVIERFPSMNDLSERIALFMRNVSGKDNAYDIESKRNWCKVLFSNRQTAFAFVQYLNNLKIHNEIYYRLRVKVCNCTLTSKYALLPQRKLNQSKSAVDISVHNKHITHTAKANAVNTSMSSNNNNNNNNMKLPSIRSSSPYLSLDDYRRVEMKLNRQKWLTKRGFISSVSNSNDGARDIKNYVHETPSESPLLHRFRSINRQKWMDHKGFL